MYLMVETIRVQTEDDRPEWRAARETFKNELGVCTQCVCTAILLTVVVSNPQTLVQPSGSPLYNGEPFALLLFTMVTKFCSMNAPHFPMKKVLLLLWKTVLVGFLCSMSFNVFHYDFM